MRPDATRLTGQHSKARTRSAFKQLGKVGPLAHGQSDPDSGRLDSWLILEGQRFIPAGPLIMSPHLQVTPEPEWTTNISVWRIKPSVHSISRQKTLTFSPRFNPPTLKSELVLSSVEQPHIREEDVCQQ